MQKIRLDITELSVSSFPTAQLAQPEQDGTYFPDCVESFSICRTCHSCGYTDCACTLTAADVAA